MGAGAAAMGAALIRPSGLAAQLIDRSVTRVVTSIDVPLPLIGSVRPRGVAEIAGSPWLLGCETLDRDFADYDAYKAYLAPLGIKRLRMQGGWAKTERVRGTYDFAWLDHIVEDAVGRGLMPWLQTSYGNPIYPGGGGANLGAGLPKSVEALAAFDRWVAAMVARYRDKVFDWEVWNEPNFGDNTINSPEETADFNVRTARVLKRAQPTARIAGLALGHYEPAFVDRFFDRVAKRKAFDLFETMTYHDYAYNPDDNVGHVRAIRASLDRYAPRVALRQGENGAPSAGGAGRGALWDYPWSELSQAKWDTRRMLGTLGMDIECSVFGIVEMAYTDGPINKLNYKGLLKSDAARRVLRPKTAYYAVQNVAAIFDDTLERMRDLHRTYNVASGAPRAWSTGTDREIALFGYRQRTTGKQIYSLWLSDSIPGDSTVLARHEVAIAGADVAEPVWVDIVTGAVHAIPPAQWRREGAVLRFRDLPIYDSPVLIADRAAIALA